jgi:putative Holliday junction resolvase
MNMRLLGIDYGSKRIGLALSDEAGGFAFPHSVIPNDGKALQKISDICAEQGISKIVIGESLDYKGKPNLVMREILPFAEKLGKATGLPLEFEKEYLTTAEASRIQGKNETIDASAAALILKSYIDKQVRQGI